MSLFININVKKHLFDILKLPTVVFLAFLMGCTAKEFEYARKVNPFIGTGGHGHTFPGASAPFGMVQLSPDTRIEGWDACSGYHYSDSTILGFSHTHLSGTGAADYGDILITPSIDEEFSPLTFQHDNEEAWAGYYSVMFENGISVRLTSTTRVGIHEYSFPKGVTTQLKIDLKHGIGPDRLTGSGWQSISNAEITGYRRSAGWAKDQIVYFTMRFSEGFKLVSDKDDSTTLILEFSNHPVVVKTGLSSVSEENAGQNIDKEAPGWNFATFVHEAEMNWDLELKKVKGTFLNESDETIFYTALYHSLLAPNTYSDANGEYRGMDKQMHTAKLTHFTVYSLWDTFRAAHPLFTILNSDQNIAMINAMLDMYRQSGLLPVWELASNETGTMIGYHSIPVIADAIIKNVPGIDYQFALKAMIVSAMEDHRGLKYYREMGYIPVEKEHESVSKTLEYAYDDWCIAEVAKKLGNDSIAAVFSERAQYYKNLFDKETGFMRPKRNGGWIKDFDPFEVSGNYTEANAWQYNYFVPHDLEGLNKLLQPKSNLEAMLDSLFTVKSNITGRQQPDIAGMIGQYAHGNEPSHNFAYLYDYTGQPWKTQELCRKIMRELYSNEPDGLTGNEDCGQMSAWYVFSALGFYPVIPGKPEYALGTPLLKSAMLKLENGNHFKITTKNLSKENLYIQSIKLNNRQYNKSYISHADIMKGGVLELVMGNQPAIQWDDEIIGHPSSHVTTKEITRVPVIMSDDMTFLDSTTVVIEAPTDDAKVFYTLDGSNPDSTALIIDGPVNIDSTLTFKAIAYEKGKLPSRIARASFIKIPFGRKITLKYPYSHLYTGNSSMALIDHIRGGNNFRDGWQGFHEVDLDAVIDLGRVMKVNEVGAGFLQDNYSWIFYPSEMLISFSIDGKSFDRIEKIENLVNPKADGLITQNLNRKFNNVRARFVKVVARNIGKCPDWHKGAGHKAWLFADEIIIKTE